jgi:transcription elongation factor Elf1
MPILFACPSCNAAYEVADDLVGKEVLCRECERRARIDAPDDRHVPFVCPHCREQTEVPASLAGRWLRCPNCERLAKVQASGAKSPTRRRVLFAAGAVLLTFATATAIFWPRGRSKDEQSPEGQPRRRSRDKNNDQPKDRAPGQPGGRGRGRRNRDKGQGPV